MPQSYNLPRTRHVYDPASSKPFPVSRSKIDLFRRCPRCLYLDLRRGLKRPPTPPFTLNSEVDRLLKMEFDLHRVRRTKHPLMKRYKINARVMPHRDLEKWRHNFTGVRYLHAPTNLEIFGAIDDLWRNSKKEFVVVDYKATAKEGEITKLDSEWHEGYKRQMDVYQWLLRRNGYKVSDRGYFVYCNGRTDARAFDGRLEFNVTVIPHDGDDSWVEETIGKLYRCLRRARAPKASPDCEYCRYVEAVSKF